MSGEPVAGIGRQRIFGLRKPSILTAPGNAFLRLWRFHARMRNLFALTALAITAPVQAQTLQGVARAVDGDTLEMTGTILDLAHVDAPELEQRCTLDGTKWNCGMDARDELSGIVDGQTVTCTVIAGKSSGRSEASCRTEIFDIGVEMVRRGMALALDGGPYEYASATKAAQSMNSGLWPATFALPWVWRAANPESASLLEKRNPKPEKTIESGQVNDASSACLIKGNRNRRGEWIYHLPGRPYYAVTRAEEWFCSESEARQAGYRRSRS